MTFSSHDDFTQAVTRVKQAAAAYYDDDAVLMTDAEYDLLVEQIEATAALHPEWVSDASRSLLEQVAAGSSTGGEVQHPEMMGSLEKAKGQDAVDKFLADLTGPVIVEPKLDGLAIRAEYKAGRLVLMATRGDGRTGENVTAQAHLVSGLPTQLPAAHDFEVRGEVFMTDADFDASNDARVQAGNKPFANPRNAVAGSLRRVDSDYDVAMSFAAYDVYPEGALAGTHEDTMKLLESWGVRTACGLVGSEPIADHTKVTEALNALESRRDDLGFPIDGAVIKATRFADRQALGMATRAPRWAVAYKYAPNEASTRLLDIEVGVGRTGRISLRAVLEPVEVGGTTVTYATLHNPAFVEAQGLAIGQTVMVVRAGDVIPRVTAPIGDQPSDLAVWTPPTACPNCSEPWDKSSLLWRCTTPECSTVGRVTYAASRDCLDIMGMSEAIAAALVDAGVVSDIADLFTLDAPTLADVVLGKTSTGGNRKVGAATAAKVIAEIDKARSQPLHRVITALGIRGTGRTISRKLASAFRSMEALQSATAADLEAVEMIGPEKANLILSGLQTMAPVISKLRAAGVTMEAETVEAAEAPLAGKTVVVTGAMTGPLAAYGRTQMNELIERLGGTASGSVSAKTSILVAADLTTSKAVKAASLGVETLTPEQFAELVGMVEQAEERKVAIARPASQDVNGIGQG